jgi:Zn-dependent metalloprotease
LCALLGALLAVPATAAAAPPDVEKLRRDGADVSLHPGTGTPRFVRLAAPPALSARAMAGARAARPVSDKAAEFLATYAAAFGLENAAAELALTRSSSDSLGGTHLTYAQRYRGLPVFGASLKTHFDAAGELRVVNGITVPDIELDAAPSRSAEEAGAAALALVAGQKGGDLSVRATELVVFRSGLLKGVAGANHLAWKVEVGNGDDVREFVFVDAHVGKVVEQFTGVTDALHRRAYNTTANYPATPFWVEGDAFPTADVEANNVILGSGEAYGLYSTAFGRDSFDGAGAVMHGVFRRTQSCPNASWNGLFTSYCAGVTPDDVVAHEWTHAYTEFTHGLIYAWQSGALNESYSDIFGEVVDFINNRGTDSPGGPRVGGFCSSFSAVPVQLVVNSPAGLGPYPAGRAQFGPPLTSAGVTGNVVLANDGTATPTLGCNAGVWANAAQIAGNIALVDRGTCGFAVKVKNAQNNGAIGVIVGNNVEGIVTMAGADPTIVISSVSIALSNANALKAQLPVTTVNTTMRSTAAGLDASYRWLVSEDSAAFGGAIRDMWTPTCLGSPGKVSDTQYHCGPIESDNGGVHVNSGVPNHAFALLVDGGVYNGHAVAPIGMTKAAHIYYRAMAVYQGPASNFADHADALDQSCADLLGVDLTDLVTGASSGQAITLADCAAVANAALAVELRTPPTQCGFDPILAQNPPDRCEAGTRQANVFFDDFETDPIGAWTVSHTAVVPADFTTRDWAWSNELPDRNGSALFGINFAGGTCAPGGDESGVLHAVSPVITLPPGAAAPRLTFDHWIATEAGWDGGNLKVSVDGGPWQLVAPVDYTYNAYNATLQTAAAGNTNPMAGEPAFSGTDEGAVDGSWGRSHVNLAPYAGPGQTVQLRFDTGNDGCTGFFGWYIDDPTVYACVPSERPRVSIGDVAVSEGNSGLTTATLAVTLSHPSPEPVTVWYVTLPGTATPIHDFVLKLDKLTIPPLHLGGTISVKVVGDQKRESDERFFVVLFLSQGGGIQDGIGQVTILNDDTRR